MAIDIAVPPMPVYEITWEPTTRDPQDVRLRAALLDAQRRLRALVVRRGPMDDVVAACERCLRRADQEAFQARYVAWDCLHQFDEEALAALTDEERAARWCSMKAEAEEKLKTAWRREAAEAIVSLVPAGESVPLHLLRELHVHLASAAQNKQHKLELFEKRSLPWVTASLLATAGAVLVASALLVAQAERPEGALVPWARAFVLGIPAGALGGILSMTFSLGAADLGAKIPDLRLSRLVTLTRPLVGAAIAIPIVVFVRADFVRLAGFEGPVAVLAFCFLGGFSERWFLGVMERFEAGKR